MDQLLDHHLAEMVFSGLGPRAVARQDEDEGGDLPGRGQLIGHLVGAQAVPLVVVVVLPVDQV